MSEEADAGSLVLRVAIQGGGCSGFQYGLGFDSGPAEGDLESTSKVCAWWSTLTAPRTCKAPRSTS